ncbi:hypothetical protein JCM3774_004327 [Rhodotorula dairenensis]
MNGNDPVQAFAGDGTGSASSGATSPAPSTTGSSHLPLPPLPIEVFLRVMQYLDPADVVSSRRVSSLWCSCINGEPRLWRDLTCSLVDDLTDQLELYSRYARPRAAGQTGGVTSLTIMLEGHRLPHNAIGDLIPIEFAVQAFKQVVKSVGDFSVSAVKAEHGPLARQGGTRYESSLRTLRIRLDPQTQAPIWVLHVLSRFRTHPLFAQLESFDLNVNCPSFPLGGNFLSMFPTLSRLSIQGCRLKSTSNDDWSWQHEDHDDDVRPLTNLRELILRDVRIAGETEIPPLPALARIHVRNVYWDNKSYYLLVRMARKSLERLELISMVFQDLSDPEEDFNDYLDIRELDLLDPLPPAYERDGMFSTFPLPILLPRLRYLRLNGLSPALWAPEYGSDDPSEYMDLPTPYFVMPALVECDLSEIMIDMIEELEPAVSPLAVLGKLAPSIRDLCLHGVVTDDRCLFACFYQMHGRLLRLDLRESSASDHFICRLPDLTPLLRELDVRGCADISVQGVARVVEVIRLIHDEGQSKVARVWIDPPASDEGWAEFQAYEWLAFLDILQRDEWDYEGDGPTDPKHRREWVRRGKLDIAHEHKIKYAEWERAQAAKRVLAEKQAAAAGSSSRRTAGLALPQASAMTALPLLPNDSSAVSLATVPPAAPMAAIRAQQPSFPADASATRQAASQPIPSPNAGPRQGLALLAQAPSQTLAAIPEQPGHDISVDKAGAESVPAIAAFPMMPPTTRPLDARDFAPQPNAVGPQSTLAYARAFQAAAAVLAQTVGTTETRQDFARVQPHHPAARPQPPLAPPTVPTTAVSPLKRKIETAESLDFDVANVDPGFVAAQEREMQRLEQAQTERLQAQIDQADNRGGGSARAKLQKMYREQQRRLVHGGGGGAEEEQQPAQAGRPPVVDSETESDDDGRPDWQVVPHEFGHADEEESVTELLVSSDEEGAAPAVVCAPAIVSASADPPAGSAAGESDDDVVELRIVPADETAERTGSPAAFEISPPPPGTDTSEEPFVPLV